MKLIVGLGNPGKQYENTFHNMGFQVVDRLAAELGVAVKKKECRALTGTAFLAGEKIVLAKPQTFMNLSGEAVRELIGRFGAKTSDLLVVYDDFDLPKGTIRVRPSGSAGTHNGMRNIVSLLGSTEFARVRVGIAPSSPVAILDYVLSEVRRADREEIDGALDEAAEAALGFARGETAEELMREHNRKGKTC